ncbi:MAG: IS256 family transposase [Actinobacteria bacterium]|nr:IS256 family transposase [Actinomycetota bacterium]
MAGATMDLQELVGKQLEEAEPDVVRAILRSTIQSLMSTEADSTCNASFGERTPERTNSRNGYRARRFDTRVGTIDLQIPKLRAGTYFPEWLLEPRLRSEKALVSVIADCYLAGVSTRRVDKLVKQLGLDGISKSQVSRLAAELDDIVTAFRDRPLDGAPYTYVWFDAHIEKVREPRSQPVAVVKAIGVNKDGFREVLGFDIITVEDGAGWVSFLRSLQARGLAGVELAISDDHPGLVAAIASVLGCRWQRCRTHFTRNVLAKVPRSAQPFVAPLVRSIFEQASKEEVWAQHARVVDQLELRFPEAAALLADAADDILAFTDFPQAHWRQIRSNNPLERFNKEVRRRTDVVGIFPNRSSVARLVGAVLAEQHDEWCVGRRYMSAESLAKARMKVIEGTNETIAEEVRKELEAAV